MNLTVMDHIAEGRQVLARADKLNAEGTTLAQREAQALRDAQAMKSEALLGETQRIRTHACPACGCWTLLPRADRAFCINRHCAPQGVQRRWTFRELAFTGPGTPGQVRTTSTQHTPRDLMDVRRLLAFFAQTGRPLSETTLRRITTTNNLPTWPNPLGRTRLYSLSDVATAHAVHAAAKAKGDCTSKAQRPPCTGLANLFFGAAQSPARQNTAKQLCATCPLKQVCLDTALEHPAYEQHGIYGGLTAKERQTLIKQRKGSA